MCTPDSAELIAGGDEVLGFDERGGVLVETGVAEVVCTGGGLGVN